MTTIAYRDGVLAADRETCYGSVRGHQATKIGQRADGAMIAGCGVATVAATFKRWFLEGEQGDRPSLGANDADDAVMIIIRPNGDVEKYDRLGWQIIEGPFFSFGSGFELALGAMAMGASAERAVQIAAEFGVGDPNRIDVLRLPPKARREVAPFSKARHSESWGA